MSSDSVGSNTRSREQLDDVAIRTSDCRHFLVTAPVAATHVLGAVESERHALEDVVRGHLHSRFVRELHDPFLILVRQPYVRFEHIVAEAPVALELHLQLRV